MTNFNIQLVNLLPLYLISFADWICSHSLVFEYSEAVSKGFDAYCYHFHNADADFDADTDTDSEFDADTDTDTDADSHGYHFHRTYC